MPRGIDRYDEARLQGRLWTPAAIQPALGCWLDAGDPSTIIYATGVSSWRDKSGRGAHATQATGALQPIYNPSGPPRITFTGQAFFDAASVTASGNSYDVLIIGKPLNAAVERKLFFGNLSVDLVMITASDAIGVWNIGTGGFDQIGALTWPGQVGLLYYRTTDIGPF